MFRLDLDAAAYKRKIFSINHQDIPCRAYENIVYVANPVEPTHEILNLYVPEAYYQGKSVGGYSAETAPIFFPNTVGGYLPGKPAAPRKRRSGVPNASLMALSKGHVVAAPGARGRTSRGKSGLYTGKAPACIVDLKAAVRYLRHNDQVIPGNTEKIISNGTSAGGALSALLGATGNNPEYEPYLEALGAADARDDIFAASCYCPIMNLENADMAYEWMFGGLDHYNRLAVVRDTDYHAQRRMIQGTLSRGQMKISEKLRAAFPAYLNRLGLQKADGTALTLQMDGTGTFKDCIRSLVIASATKALCDGKDLSGSSGIIPQGGNVTDIDFDQYLQYCSRIKTPPAFDGLDLSTCENDLFGAEAIGARHFTRFGLENSTVNGALADAAIVKLMNPMDYIGVRGTTTAPHWRIRHGTLDSDTSVAIPVMLAAKLENSGCRVDFALPWDQRHGGDYDLEGLFSWTTRVCSEPDGSSMDPDAFDNL